MTDWSLATILAGLHDDIEQRLGIARKSFAHAPTKGDASERVWLDLLNTYLPARYHAATVHVVDSAGHFSDQIDVAVFDRQYSPFIFQFEGQTIIPAESVYAVFEAKQKISSELVKYAGDKVASVRKLLRTSLPIPHAGGVYDSKPLIHIIGGILALESDWSPPLGKPLENALTGSGLDARLDIGCIAAHGLFTVSKEGIVVTPDGKPATSFVFELIARLQEGATVPMMDVRAYAKWLET